MKLLVALCLIAVVAAAPPPRLNNYPYQPQRFQPQPYKPQPFQPQPYHPQPYHGAQILRYENDNIGLGNYRYEFEQTDGTRAAQQGQIKNEGREDESLAVQGTFSWIGPDGVTYTVNYTADEDGYKPEIEQGPGGGVPPAVVASLLG